MTSMRIIRVQKTGVAAVVWSTTWPLFSNIAVAQKRGSSLQTSWKFALKCMLKKGGAHSVFYMNFVPAQEASEIVVRI